MLLSEGDTVKYKNIEGVVAFICDYSLSILVNKGQSKVQDVRVVVYKSDFKKIVKL
jgi:hypothetical protein